MAFNCNTSPAPPFTLPSFSWLATTSTTASFLKLHSFPLFEFCMPTTSFISSCFKPNPTSLGTNSSPPSFSWFKPFSRRRNMVVVPEIVRHWVGADQLLASPDDADRFTVASYNILADDNAFKHRDLYKNVPTSCLRWGGRKKLISKELMELSPDVICLQEVDKYSDLLRVMEKGGYSGSYKRRTGSCKDGCAMFWKVDRLQLLEMEGIEFKDVGFRDNVAQLALFQMRKAETRRLLVGNIHVLYNPSRGDIKLGQIRSLFSSAQILSKRWNNAPIVLAGDFNCTPQSAIYKFISSSELNVSFYDTRELCGQRSYRGGQVLSNKKEFPSPITLIERLSRRDWKEKDLATATGDRESHLVKHSLNLKSSYATIKSSAGTRGFHGEPLATSYHSKFFGTVDYLWYSDCLIPTRVLDTVPTNLLQRTGGLPCEELGSDHLALASEFAFLVENQNDDKNVQESNICLD